MIEVQELTKRYGATLAVDRISFEAREGEVLGLLGPNAAGKTTTMRVVTGYLAPSSGAVRVAGFDVATAGDEVRRRIGYLPERPPLYPDMTVRAYLRFVADLKGVPAADRGRAVGAALERTATADVAHQVIATLSKGYQQRVGIAQALVHNPPVLVLDEPTVGLDPKQILEVRGLIRGLAGDHTVLLSSHILPEVAAVCGRVVIIRRGRVAAIDSPGNLTRRLLGGERLEAIVSGGAVDSCGGRGPGTPQHPASAATDDSFLAACRNVEGVVAAARAGTPADGLHTVHVDCDKAHLVGPFVARLAVEHGLALHHLARVDLSLEEIFLRLTADNSCGEHLPGAPRIPASAAADGAADTTGGTP